MYIPGHVVLEFSAEQIESMRDSVFGYKDELACSIFNGENAGQYVLGHVGAEQYNFDDGYSTYRTSFHHEFTHTILGFSNLKRGYNPLPFEYGYDGNGIAEALVIPIQTFFDEPNYYNQKTKENYVSEAMKIMANEKGNMLDSTLSSVEACNASETLTSLFEERRKTNFQRPNQGHLSIRCITFRPVKRTKWKEKVYRGQPLARHIAEQFHDDFQPVYELCKRNYERLMTDKEFAFPDHFTTRRDYLKTIPTQLMWDAMNDPQVSETFNIDHRKTLTGEFILLYDPDFEFFREIVGIDNIRNIVGYEELAKPFDHREYRLFKDNIDEIKSALDIVGSGRFIHKQKEGQAYQDFIKKALEINKQRSQIYEDLVLSLVLNGTNKFMNRLSQNSSRFISRTAKAALTPST
jgi:hypothetical protein